MHIYTYTHTLVSKFMCVCMCVCVGGDGMNHLGKLILISASIYKDLLGYIS